MTTRWEVEQAVLWSELRPPARLIMLTLAVKSNNETAVVEPEYAPSLTTLQRATGLARSMVTDYLNELERLGWVVRSRPASKGTRERTSYRLCVPTSPLGGLGRDADRTGSSPQEGLDRQEDQSSSPPSGPVREADQQPPAETQTASGEASSTSPPGGHATTKPTTSQSGNSTSGKRGVRGESGDSKGTRIPDDFWPDEKMIAWAKANTPLVGIASTEAFIDWAKSATGRTACKRDWAAAWRNWMRRDQEKYQARQPRINGSRDSPASERGYGNAYRPSTTDQRVAAGLEIGRRLQAQADAQQQKEITS